MQGIREKIDKNTTKTKGECLSCDKDTYQDQNSHRFKNHIITTGQGE